MVQIIHVRWMAITSEPDFLYIPHGSDNTVFEIESVFKFIKLYIPHGSDNT